MKKSTNDSALSRVRKSSQNMNFLRKERRTGKGQPLLVLGGVLLAGFVMTRLLKGANRRDHVSDWRKRGEHDAILDRDQSSPVSVSSGKQGHPSYSHNADKSTPYDPHLSDENPPGWTPDPRNVQYDALDRDKPGPVSVASRDRLKGHDQHTAKRSAHAGEGDKAKVLDRDQSSPVSVSADAQGHTSYTYNADKTTPYDPHMSDENPPGWTPDPQDTEHDALDRDKPGPVSMRGDKSSR